MELRILGCQGPYPGPEGATSGYLLSHGDTHVLIECGSGVLARLWRHIRPEQLGAVALSHLHSDHISDLLVFRYQAPSLRAEGLPALPVYAPQEPAAEYTLLSQGGFAMHPYAPDVEVQPGGMRMRCFPVRHPVPSFALRFEAEGRVFVYSGDTNTAPGLAEFAAGAHLMLVDAAFTDAQWAFEKPHLSARLAATIGKEAEVERLVLTHFAPGADVEELRREAEDVYPGVETASPDAAWII